MELTHIFCLKILYPCKVFPWIVNGKSQTLYQYLEHQNFIFPKYSFVFKVLSWIPNFSKDSSNSIFT